jgi:glutathione synthase/RimK-type ligase-like ATP-grasp enzyme
LAILFINGINDRSVIGVKLDRNSRLVQLIDGNTSIHRRLPLKPGIDHEFMLFGKGVQQHAVQFQVQPSLIFNQIADADTHRGALDRCIELCRQVDSKVINRPEKVLQTTRDQVSARLQGIPGLVMPRILRFRPQSPEAVLEFALENRILHPYFVRVAGGHHGRNMVRLDSPGDMSSLHALPFDGRDYYLSQFVDYRAEDGLYHKLRIIVIDGEPLLRHALYHDNWLVHASARAFMKQRESWQEDIARFDRLSAEELPKLRSLIDEITKRLELEYYGIDCSLLPDGRLLVFEANANMNVLHSPNQATRYRVEAIQQALYRMLEKYSGEQVI